MLFFPVSISSTTTLVSLSKVVVALLSAFEIPFVRLLLLSIAEDCCCFCTSP